MEWIESFIRPIREVESLTNYQFYLMPNGLYRVQRPVCDNFLFPLYFVRENSYFVVSTSVYSLIRYKGRFVRNPRFQTVHFYRPSYSTIDAEVMRLRTPERGSTYELTDKKVLTEMGARLIQEYVTEIENLFPEHTHILLMGGKDSENIILTSRRSPWIVVSGEPNAPLNQELIARNRIDIERFVYLTNDVDDSMLREEIMASDCMFDVKDFRWMRVLGDLVDSLNGKAVIWIGSTGDSIFCRNLNHRFDDYYAVHNLHVGTTMGIWHQMFKNLFDIPVVSPYQSPKFLDELFHRFDPYFLGPDDDVRPEIGRILLGRDVWYPSTNPRPAPWRSADRDRRKSTAVYLAQLAADGIPCELDRLASMIEHTKQTIGYLWDVHSAKRRTKLSKVLFPARNVLGKWIPPLRNRRFEMREIP